MRLKRVKLFGFKTFADKTEFDLDGGIVAVVGPNGCGKSNLVDAMLWGLGEVNSRHLRAAHSQDVIFSGSTKRRAVGYAEVSLCFDNEDGTLPVDASEVWLTRRLTRAGDSDYFINRQSVRQRDVLELLADSGLGRAGYAIVGQKEIDQALAASAEDRRGWIDEAAGVQRYRSRKVESLKRLSQAQEHLSRVSDILAEIEKQRDPMREEAELAIRYKSLVASLREVELGLLVNELCAAVRESEELETRIQESLRLLKQEQDRAEKLDREVKSTGESISSLELEMDDVRGLQQKLLTGIERLEADIRLSEQKLAALAETEQNLRTDSGQDDERIELAEKELGEARGDHVRESEELERISVEGSGIDTEAQQLRAALKDAERVLEQARAADRLRLKLEAESQARNDRLQAAQRELDGIEKSLPDLEGALQEAESEFQEYEAKRTALISEIEAFRSEIAAVRESEETDLQEVRRAMSERASLEGRKRGIEATLETHEGMSQGARAVLEACERGQLKGRYEAVAEVIEADREVALAIETALGASANDLIVDHESDAKSAIRYLKENQAGRATFQPISLMRPSEPSRELEQVLMKPGVVGLASKLVDCEQRVRPVINSLLGRIVVVETIDHALALAKTYGWSRMVTLDGEVVHSSGAVTGGKQARQGYGLVQRKADLAEIEETLERVNKTIGQYESRNEKRNSQVQSAQDAVVAKESELAKIKVPLKEALEYRDGLASERNGAIRDRDRLVAEMGRLKQVESEIPQAVDLVELEAKRDEILKAVAAKSADAEQFEGRLKDSKNRVYQAHLRLSAAERRLQAAKDAKEHRSKRIDNLEPERQKVLAHIEELRQKLSESLQERESIESKLNRLQAERRTLLETSLRLTEESKEARATAMSLGDANHRSELARARAESKRANAAERLMDAYGLSETDALEQEGQHEVPADAAMVVGRLRREIRAMGDVNVGAIEAYERLTQRYEELSVQLEDIFGGIKQVESSIAELDKLTRDKFLNTFEQVRVAFSELFTQLFGGGGAELSLTDTERVLESGVDISVQLPGKRKQPLQLLSGGERSLCASAFLFSLLKVKPAPLVVLDEVDAPLDGRNVERFAGLLAEFSKSIQFIVITHNPVTIEVAPTWLGVTMQEPGVSTLVPARLPESKTVVREGSAIDPDSALETPEVEALVQANASLQ